MVAATAKSSSKKSTTENKDKSSSKILSSSKGRVDPALVERAVAALVKYHKDQQANKQQTNAPRQLLGSDSVMHVQFGLTVGPERPSLKPIAIPLPYPICKMVRGGDSNDDSNSNTDDDDDGLEEAEVCLIVKEDSKPWVQEMIAQFPQYMGNIKKVLGLDSLRKKHAASPQQRRDLLARYSLFLCDDRILPLVKNALGKEFIARKKYPLPVDLTRKQHLPVAIFQSLRSTFMHLKDGGCCVSICTGTTGMAPKKLVANVLAICELAVPRMPRKWANVQSICLSTPESIGLPIYNKIPAELDAISKMAGLPSIWKSSKEMKEEEEEEQGDESDGGDDDQEKKDQQKRKRKELAAKSPLVRALKQQKKQKKESTGSTAESTNDDKKAKKAAAAQQESSSSSSKPTTIKKKRRSHNDDEDKDATPVDGTKKSSSSSSSSSNSKSQKKDKESSEAAKSFKTDNKAKKVVVVDAELSSTKAATKEKNKDFIQASKFKGSKKGYVFTKGKHGLGYYLDVKPVVDKLAIEALVRMGTARQQRGSGGGSHKKSGKKGRRGSGGGGGGGRRRSY